MNPLEARRRLLGRNVYKRTTEGNPAIAQGSLARMYPGIEMEGWTEQESTTGAQLLQLEADVATSSDPYYPGYTVTKNGLTATVLEDGGIRITGSDTTESGWNNIVFVTFTADGQYKLPPGTYTVTDCTLRLSVSNKTGTFTIEEEVTVLGWCITYTAGTSNVDDLYYPMLNSGSEALPWEQYTGGQPSPSPDYPQEIISAGKYNEETQKWEYEVKLTGKNLFNPTEFVVDEPKVINGRTYVLRSDGGIEVTTQDSSSDTSSVFFTSEPIYLPEGTSIILSGNPTKYGVTAQIVDEYGKNVNTIGTSKGSSSRPHVLKKGEYIKWIWLYGASGTSDNGTMYIQLEVGSVTEYELPKVSQTVTLTADRPPDQVGQAGEERWTVGVGV